MLRHIGPITQDNQFRELAFTLFLASLWSKYASENKWNYFMQKHVTVLIGMKCYKLQAINTIIMTLNAC